MKAESVTSLSLLARIREQPGDAKGWDEFVQRYEPRIYSWCRKWGLDDSDARDVCQNVMLKLCQQLKDFEYDPNGRFRGWLRTIAHHAWYDFAHRRKNMEFQHDSVVWQALASQQAGEDLLEQLVEECNRELMHCAMERVKDRVQDNSWQAFYLTEFEGQPTEEVCQKLGMSKGAVYVARGRIQRMLLTEIEHLDRMQHGTACEERRMPNKE